MRDKAVGIWVIVDIQTAISINLNICDEICDTMA